MAIRYELDSRRQIVRTTCVGDITLSDMLWYARGLVDQRLLGGDPTGGKQLGDLRVVDGELAQLSISKTINPRVTDIEDHPVR